MQHCRSTSLLTSGRKIHIYNSVFWYLNMHTNIYFKIFFFYKLRIFFQNLSNLKCTEIAYCGKENLIWYLSHSLWSTRTIKKVRYSTLPCKHANMVLYIHIFEISPSFQIFCTYLTSKNIFVTVALQTQLSLGKQICVLITAVNS